MGKRPNVFEKLRKKWKINSNLDLFLIMVVFSVSGMSIIPVRHVIFMLFGYTDKTSVFLKIITWLVFVFPTYQIFLLIYGLILGQISFFWEKEKKMVRWIARKMRILPGK